MFRSVTGAAPSTLWRARMRRMTLAPSAREMPVTRPMGPFGPRPRLMCTLPVPGERNASGPPPATARLPGGPRDGLPGRPVFTVR
ncbi:hypothetical protein ASNO1_01720 [Corallococcus caeni]|uniref:Uncharacterized protein n=1 Tax=Corallococcus caeni TaxID=3082388 RepID=A0ABQ6QIN0_9BACT|nr:hypothetical protein ASNO1_01720 [Corallococcus sp. NO1]